MLHYALSGIICDEFSNRFRWEGGEINNTAMLVEFRLNREGDTRHDVLQIILWGPQNYVGVWARVTDTIDRLSEIKIDSDSFHLFSYHDSCWRSDGIERIIFDLSRSISIINTLGRSHWNSPLVLTPDQMDTLKGYIRRRDNGEFPPMPQPLYEAIDEIKSRR